MNIGIVGSEGAKFTPETEAAARQLMILLVSPGDTIVSGACHLGGIDIWAEEMADTLGLNKLIFPPAKRQWEGGYKQRNLEIAKNSDWVHCITVRELPQDFKGMRFVRCYHCNSTDHVKSGGCWTVKQARLMGKQGQVHVVG